MKMLKAILLGCFLVAGVLALEDGCVHSKRFPSDYIIDPGSVDVPPGTSNPPRHK
jgi:hypothetical protein